MITISDHQILSLKVESEERFLKKVALLCRTVSTAVGNIPDSALYPELSRFMAQARKFGFSTELDVAKFIVLCVFFNGRIPVGISAKTDVMDSTVSPSYRIARLYRHAIRNAERINMR